MNILIACFQYGGLTGSEIYYKIIHDELINQGHKVYILSFCRTEKYIPNFYDYRFREQVVNCFQNDYDLVLGSHIISSIIHFSSLYKEIYKVIQKAKLIQICHSEVIGLEKPYFSSLINGYISVRQSIYEMIVENENYKHNKKPIQNIGNPFDTKLFNDSLVEPKKPYSEINYSWFGSIDVLRKNSIINFISSNFSENGLVENPTNYRLVGRNDDIFTKEEVNTFKESNKSIHFTNAVDYKQIPILIKRSKLTAGINFGRTFYESILCGVPHVNYNIDSSGKILSKQFYHPTKEKQEEIKAENSSSEIVKKILKFAEKL